MVALLPASPTVHDVVYTSAATTTLPDEVGFTCELPIPDIPKRFGGKDLKMKDVIKLRYR